MAEERLIDTDKDKKYRIRKNADGEDELYIEDGAEEEETEEVTFMVEEETEGNEGDSDEDYALNEELQHRAVEAAELIEKARMDCEVGRYATAADYLEKAIELNPENGDIYALELIIYTRNFTDYSMVKDVLGYVDELEKYTSAQTKEALFSKARTGLEENISSLSQTVESLSEENEKQKAVRAKKFIADRNSTAVLMSLSLAILAAFAGLSIYCFLNIHSVQTNGYLIAAIVLTAFAVISLIIAGFILNKLLTACRRVRLNKKNTATELGRKMLLHKADLDAFTAIYKALKG